MAKINKIKLSGTSYDIQDLNASKTVELTQAQYDALVDKDPNTFYIITDAQGGDLSNYYTKSETSGATQISTALASKQTTLTAGTNITIVDNVISATGGGGDGKAIEGGRGISITTGATADTVSFNLPISAGTGTDSIIMGLENNIASGTRSFAGGGSNSISKVSATKDYAFAYGTGLNAKGSYSAVFGSSNTVEANGAFAAGYNNYIYGIYGVGFGQRVIGNNQSEISLGNFNVSHQSNTTFGDSGNTLFSVGNGTSNNARHNAFEIRQNGDIYCSDGTNDVKLQDTITATAANTTALGGLSLVKLTQTEYDNLSTKDSNTLYVIVN